jgi:hypothetical protein
VPATSSSSIAEASVRNGLIDELLRLYDTEETHLNERAGKNWIGSLGTTTHVARKQDRDLVKEKQQRLRPVGLVQAPIGLGVVVGNFR